MGLSRYLAKLGALIGSDGKVPAAGLASGAALANLGFTPANKAGDSITGALNFTGQGQVQFNGTALNYNLTHNYNNAGTVSSVNSLVEVCKWNYKYEFSDYLGTGGTTNQYFYLHIPVGMNFVGTFIVELFAGGWSWGQASVYARWVVQVVNGTTTITNLESVGASSYSCVSKAYNANSGSNMYQRLGIGCSGGSNSIYVRVHATNPLDYWSGFYTGAQSSNPAA